MSRIRVSMEFFSIMSKWMGETHASVVLAPGATYGDLLAHIGKAYESRMPSQLWRREDNAFAEQVAAFRNGIRMEDRATGLHDGDQIRFMPMMGGG